MNRPIHFEILGDDPAALAAFYGNLFGWRVNTWEGPQSYWLVSTGDDHPHGMSGGIMHRHFKQAVINTMHVDSIEAMITRIEAAGGRRISGPNEVPGVGLHAYCADPEGNLFGIMQPLPPGEAAGDET